MKTNGRETLIEAEEQQGVAVVRVCTRRFFDPAVAEMVGGGILAILTKRHCQRAVLDLHDVDCIDMPFLAVLTALSEHCQGNLVVCGLQCGPALVLKALGAHQQFVVRDTTQEAISSLVG